jgi:hypothetical protein
LLFFIRGMERMGRNQNLSAREPVSSFGDKISNGPVGVVKVEVLNLTYRSVEAL